MLIVAVQIEKRSVSVWVRRASEPRDDNNPVVISRRNTHCRRNVEYSKVFHPNQTAARIIAG
ncbi:hypothetical protein LDC_2553, partial [sediment metagenome]